MEHIWPLIWQALAGGLGGGLLGKFMKTRGENRPVIGAITGAIGGVASGQGFEAADLSNALRPLLQTAMDSLLGAMSDPHIGGTLTAILGGGLLHSVAGRYIGKKNDDSAA